jgi:RNA polymerase sigma-70 factor, ECF subfamily
MDSTGQRRVLMPPSKLVSDIGTGDRDLAARCLAGDREAFEGLYRQHVGRLYNLAYRMSGSGDAADDLVQEMFLQAFRKLGSYKGESSLGTWLYRLGVNLCLDRLRSKAGKMEKVTDSIDEEDAAPVVAPGSPAELNVTRMDLERAIGTLPPSYKAAFVLHDVEGYQHDEIARMLDISEGSSKSLLHKARMKLRKSLG